MTVQLWMLVLFVGCKSSETQHAKPQVAPNPLVAEAGVPVDAFASVHNAEVETKNEAGHSTDSTKQTEADAKTMTARAKISDMLRSLVGADLAVKVAVKGAALVR